MSSSLEMHEREQEPRKLHVLFLLILVADFLLWSWILWRAIHRPSSDFALGTIQGRVLVGTFMFAGLPAITFLLLLYDQAGVAIVYAILKFLGALKLAAQVIGMSTIGKDVWWIAYAQVGWTLFASALAAVYFFARFRFGPEIPSPTSPKLTLVEKLESLQKLRADGILSEEQFNRLRQKLVKDEE